MSPRDSGPVSPSVKTEDWTRMVVPSLGSTSGDSDLITFKCGWAAGSLKSKG